MKAAAAAAALGLAAAAGALAWGLAAGAPRRLAAPPAPGWAEIERGAPDYLSRARNWVLKRDLHSDGDGERHSAHRAPLYPAFLALVQAAGGDPAAPRVLRLQSAAGALCALGALALGWALGGPAAGLLSAALYWSSPALAESARTLNVELLYLVCLLAVGLCLASWARSPTPAAAGWLGAAVGLSLACRSPLVFAPFVLAPAAARAAGPKAGRRALLAFSLGALLPLVPWTARNALLLGRFIPFEDAAAGEALYGASVGFVEYPEGRGEVIYARADAQMPGWRRSTHAGGFGRLQRQAFENIAAAPASYALSCLRRLARMASFEAGLPFSAPLGLLLAAAALAPLAAARAPAAACLGLAAGYLLLHGAVVGAQRYLWPVFPVVYALAAAGVCAAARRASRAALGAPPARWDGAGARAGETLARAGGRLLVCGLGGIWAFGAVLLAVETASGSPPAAQAALERSAALTAAGRPSQGLEEARAAAGLRPSAPEPEAAAARALSALGRHGEAAERWTRALERAERLGLHYLVGQALMGRAAARMEAGDAGWLEDLRAGLAVPAGDSHHFGAEVARLHARSESLERRWFEGAARLAGPGGAERFARRRREFHQGGPNPPSAPASPQGPTAEDLRRRAEAERLARADDAALLRGDWPALGERCAQAIERRGLGSAPAAWLQACAGLRPADASLRADLGVSLAREGKVAQARLALAQALALDPGLPQAHLSLAALSERDGRRDEARSHYEAALAAASRARQLELAEAARAALARLRGGLR